MRRTLNELYRICQKACEGAGAPDGLDIEAAHGAVWLTARGFPVLDPLLGDLSRSMAQADPYSFEESEIAAGPLDATYKAGALIAPALVGLLVARAQDGGSKEPLQVTCVSAPLYLLPAAADYVPRGWCFRLTLNTVHGMQFVLRARSEGIDVLGMPGTKLTTLLDNEYFDLHAACTQSGGDIPKDESPLEVLVSADTLSRRAGLALADGLYVDSDLWTRLSALAARVLVPATEASRQRGAGSDSSDSE